MSNKSKSDRFKEYVDGPWTSEPDSLDFEVKGIRCALRRGPWGAWCGYAGINKEHALFESECQSIDLNVHGGITFHRPECPPAIGEEWTKDGLWWLGFDCSHYRDLSPHDVTQEGMREGEYRTIGYAKEELTSLAEQLAAYKPEDAQLNSEDYTKLEAQNKALLEVVKEVRGQFGADVQAMRFVLGREVTASIVEALAAAGITLE